VPHPPALPRRLAAAPPARAALAALAWAAGLSACTTPQEIAECPGLGMASLDLVATRTAASCQDDTAPADGDAACAAATPPQTVQCLLARPVPPCCFDALFPPVVTFTATFAYGPQDGSAALCLPRPGASPYLGTRTAAVGGDELSVALDTSGAVLTSCSAGCSVTVRHEVTGLLARDPESGAVTGFTGQHVETASPTAAADCTPCTAPCTATWSLAPAPAP
jgi:hypothetical protein